MQWNELRPEESKWDIPIDERLHRLFADEAEAQAEIDTVEEQ